MPDPSIPAGFRDLLEDPGVAVLSTHNPDGHIQSTAVWYFLDGDTVRLSLSDARQKLRNIERDPHVNLFRLDPTNPMRSIELRATASVERDDGSFMAKMGAKYGADLSSFDGPDESRYVVTLRLHRVVARDMSEG